MTPGPERSDTYSSHGAVNRRKSVDPWAGYNEQQENLFFDPYENNDKPRMNGRRTPGINIV